MAVSKAKALALLAFSELENEEYKRNITELILPLVASISSTDRVDAVRIPGYFETVIPLYTDDTYKSHFRLRKTPVESLCLKIGNFDQFFKSNSGGRPMEPLRSIADRFDVTESTALRIIRRVSKAIMCCLVPVNIVWPSGSSIIEVANGFKFLKGMEGVIGAIDGMHIEISGQSFCNENYINRKGFSSIVLQGVCDHNMRFTDCYTGWSGSVDDARVFGKSDLQRILNDPRTMVPNRTFMVGDTAYKLETFMMTPYKCINALDSIKKKYNYTQFPTRNIIERAFVLLKSRFP
ncbi:putative nuclease HARBI1 [Hydractinia symbiolongicarpus]|uniref:putative nuclease HARBI1 n=1 Tax=Hydractinia symbiolongicarpus TaxID=13093 RepID=UPI00254AE789|nr:putative nuclease HARBI1 [Hydractinia symbiolongicarpus]